MSSGCGSGVDVYTCSSLVGEQGKVYGIDMTDQQLDRAKSFIDYHAQLFKFKNSNVSFHKALIEDLSFIPDNSIDVVISNCVINLSPNKEKVFREIYRILNQGGELYFSDVYADRRIPSELQQDKVIWGECLSGALYLEDFRRLMAKVGFVDVRCVSTSQVGVQNPEIEKRIGPIVFYSKTLRAFKIPLEDRCEDYAQVATYNGSISDFPNSFFLDDHHSFRTGCPIAVCGNTADMLSKTRYKEHFSVSSPQPHKGLFPCGPSSAHVVGSGGSCC